jgi:hypothetical protein
MQHSHTATSQRLHTNNDIVTRNTTDSRYGISLRANVTSVYVALDCVIVL